MVLKPDLATSNIFIKQQCYVCCDFCCPVGYILYMKRHKNKNLIQRVKVTFAKNWQDRNVLSASKWLYILHHSYVWQSFGRLYAKKSFTTLFVTTPAPRHWMNKLSHSAIYWIYTLSKAEITGKAFEWNKVSIRYTVRFYSGFSAGIRQVSIFTCSVSNVGSLQILIVCVIM